MVRVLSATELQTEIKEAQDHIEQNESIILINGSPDFHQIVHLDGYTFSEVIRLGSNIGADIMYSSIEKTGDGDIEWARWFFVYNGVAHIQYAECTELADVRSAETEEQIDELERKRGLANELLENYSEVMNEAQMYRLRNNVEDLQMEYLLRLQDRLQEEKERKELEEQIDEELERELADAVYRSDQFDRQFNVMDTEMLLRQLDVGFDDNAIRIEEIHRRAKSHLKVDG